MDEIGEDEQEEDCMQESGLDVPIFQVEYS
jgi:hypothetical protein